MCGIAGEIRFDTSLPDTSAVVRMAEKLAPRGPDGAGVYAQGRFALAHRRLKIIDVHPERDVGHIAFAGDIDQMATKRFGTVDRVYA